MVGGQGPQGSSTSHRPASDKEITRALLEGQNNKDPEIQICKSCLNLGCFIRVLTEENDVLSRKLFETQSPYQAG